MTVVGGRQIDLGLSLLDIRRHQRPMETAPKTIRGEPSKAAIAHEPNTASAPPPRCSAQCFGAACMQAGRPNHRGRWVLCVCARPRNRIASTPCQSIEQGTMHRPSRPSNPLPTTNSHTRSIDRCLDHQPHSRTLPSFPSHRQAACPPKSSSAVVIPSPSPPSVIPRQ